MLQFICLFSWVFEIISLNYLSNLRELVCKWKIFFFNFHVRLSCEFRTCSTGPASGDVCRFGNSLGTEDCCSCNIASFLLFNRLAEYPWFGGWLSNQLYTKVGFDFVSECHFLRRNAFSVFGVLQTMSPKKLFHLLMQWTRRIKAVVSYDFEDNGGWHWWYEG